jgi:hypothetical protein
MGRRLRYGLLAGCLGLIALHAESATEAWDGGAPTYASAPGPQTLPEPGGAAPDVLADGDATTLQVADAGR